ncbi:hypothetical protein M405DRAFT_880462 [Rhizopogon salebrosus TDB-379]|nr:hypothetical protein M405DRAFT_880462 [Rhizopogon salebrosus TDB-379]
MDMANAQYYTYVTSGVGRAYYFNIIVFYMFYYHILTEMKQIRWEMVEIMFWFTSHELDLPPWGVANASWWHLPTPSIQAILADVANGTHKNIIVVAMAHNVAR